MFCYVIIVMPPYEWATWVHPLYLVMMVERALGLFASGGSSRYKQGSIVFYGLNLEESNVTLTFEKPLMDQEKHLYWLYPFGRSQLKSKYVTF